MWLIATLAALQTYLAEVNRVLYDEAAPVPCVCGQAHSPTRPALPCGSRYIETHALILDCGGVYYLPIDGIPGSIARPGVVVGGLPDGCTPVCEEY